MENEQSIGQFDPKPLSIHDEAQWKDWLIKPFSERPHFKLSGQTLHISQLLVRVLGVPLDVDQYYNDLLEFSSLPEYGITILDDKRLDRTIDPQKFQHAQELVQTASQQNLSINRLIAFADGKRLLPKHSHPAIHRGLRTALIKTLHTFQEQEQLGFQADTFRRVWIDIVKWTANHAIPMLDDISVEERMPHILWYGDASKSQQYFLIYLCYIGCDVVTVHPGGVDVLEWFPDKSYVQTFPERDDEEVPFPTEKRQRKATVAYRASQEMDRVLHNEQSSLYKPWQFREYTPKAITLRTTYDEAFLMTKERAFVRPNFHVENGEVHIPSVFVKIQGVSKDRKEYWDRLHDIVALEPSLLVQKFPFSKTITSDFRYHYQHALDRSGKLSPKNMRQAHYWQYKHLAEGLQQGLAETIRDVCQDPKFAKQGSDTDEDVKVFLFTQAMHIPDEMMRMLQQFDYSQAVPKLVLYNNEQNGTLSRHDAALLRILSKMGIDVFLYNPPGHNDIEPHLDDELFDVHWLEDVVFDQAFKEPSFLKKMTWGMKKFTR